MGKVDLFIHPSSKIKKKTNLLILNFRCPGFQSFSGLDWLFCFWKIVHTVELLTTFRRLHLIELHSEVFFFLKGHLYNIFKYFHITNISNNGTFLLLYREKLFEIRCQHYLNSSVNANTNLSSVLKVCLKFQRYKIIIFHQFQFAWITEVLPFHSELFYQPKSNQAITILLFPDRILFTRPNIDNNDYTLCIRRQIEF